MTNLVQTFGANISQYIEVILKKDTDSESAYNSELFVKVWPKSQKCRFLDKIRHGYGIFWYQSIGFGQGYSGPVLGRYVRVCGSRCFYDLIGASCASTVSAPVSPRDRINCCIRIHKK